MFFATGDPIFLLIITSNFFLLDGPLHQVTILGYDFFTTENLDLARTDMHIAALDC